MSSGAGNNRPGSFKSQAGSDDSFQGSPGYNSKAPRGDKVVELVDLVEIKARWGVGHDRIWRAVAQGLIRAYGRPGRQKYYSAAEIEDWLSSSVGGRQLRFAEFDSDALTA